VPIVIKGGEKEGKMAESKYKWDIESLNANLRRLKTERQNLSQSRTFLSGLRDEIVANWQGISGMAYEGRLDLDMQNYDKIIAGLDARINRLDDITNKVYQNCENEVSAVVRSMAGRINPI
jgi:uncharacterized protein YukE